MTDREIFDPAATARRLAEADMWGGLDPTPMVLGDNELDAIAATSEANGMSLLFQGTYPHAGEKRAGYRNPAPPGQGGAP